MALKQNVIYIYFKGKHSVTSKSQYQYNHGQFLYFADLDLPQTFEVHFSNTDEGYAKPQIGSNRLVEIPDPYFWTKSSQIYAWIYLHEGTTDGETKYEVIINLERRSEPVYEEILPTQQTTIERAIAELNNAVDVTTENANKTGEDRTQVSNIKDEIVDLKEDIDANAELATEKAQEAVNASLRSEASAQNAAEYESNAHDYSDEAKDYAQQALESKIIASQKATIATDASVETLGYRDETLVAKNDVLNLKQDVIDYKNETKGYLDETKGVRADVQNIDNEVKDYASQAQASATSASQSATASANSASASANSASQAEQIKSDVEELERDAQGYANSASQSASQASASEQGCARAVSDATSAAAIARARAEEASGYAQTASTKASEAVGCVETASQKATESAQSASQALTYKTDAEQAKTASQTAQGLAESARDSAVQAKTDAESAKADAESARDEAQQTVASISGALAEKAPIITDTASGSIASFSDGADDLPLKSLVVDINPIQDLHGQDAPYPAGGGKNLFDVSNPNTVAGYIGTTAFSTGNDKAKTVYISITPNTTYTVSKLAGMRFTIATSEVIPSNGATLTVKQTNNNMATELTITSGENDAYLWAWVYFQDTDAVTYEEMLATVQIELGSTATDYAPYENICPITGWTQVDVNHSGADMTNPTTITIDLGQTVYGGKLDVLSGVLVVDRAMVDLGSLTWQKLDSYEGVFIAGIQGKADGVFNLICSAYATSSVGSAALMPDCSIVANVRGAITFVKDISKANMTAAEFKEAVSGFMCCYEIASPIEIQLTPNQVNSLYGVNNLWADSGDTEAEYRANTKLWVQKKITEAVAAALNS